MTSSKEIIKLLKDREQVVNLLDLCLQALETLREKQVNIHWIIESDNLYEYNNCHGWFKLTQEEYNLLKEIGL